MVDPVETSAQKPTRKMQRITFWGKIAKFLASAVMLIFGIAGLLMSLCGTLFTLVAIGSNALSFLAVLGPTIVLGVFTIASFKAYMAIRRLPDRHIEENKTDGGEKIDQKDVGGSE